jgi:DNA-binding transcriptional regulator LsrR (DeoR family)
MSRASAGRYNRREIHLKVAEVRRAIAEMPDGYRSVLTLYLFEGYDHEEIAHILQVKEPSARTQYIRAKQKPLMKLKNHGNRKPHTNSNNLERFVRITARLDNIEPSAKPGTRSAKQW